MASNQKNYQVDRNSNDYIFIAIGKFFYHISKEKNSKNIYILISCTYYSARHVCTTQPLPAFILVPLAPDTIRTGTDRGLARNRPGPHRKRRPTRPQPVTDWIAANAGSGENEKWQKSGGATEVAREFSTGSGRKSTCQHRRPATLASKIPSFPATIRS